MLKYKIVLVFLSLFLFCENEHKQDILVNNFMWELVKDRDNVGESLEWYFSENKPQNTISVDTLIDWNILLKEEYAGIGWYFSSFNLENVPPQVALYLENIDDEGIMWLNGKKVGSHTGANEEIKMDISSLLNQGKNFLAVKINDFGGQGGLIGKVKLETFENKEDLLRGQYYYQKAPESPTWAKNAIIYEVNTRQYTHEGTFKAFEQHLARLKELGVNVLWFMPIHPIGEKNRKGTLGSYYSIKDFYGINPEFGHLEDFQSLVDKIHELGMYVIIDLVANHTAWDNPLTVQHPEWYTRNENGDIIAPVPDWSDVADLNYDNADLRKYMTDMMIYWIKEINIDGFRCDVAEMVPDDFWVHAIAELRKIKPVLMLAEGQHPRLHANGFNMSYAFNTYWLFNDIYTGSRSIFEIDKFLDIDKYKYPPGSQRMRFTSNHDQNSWHGSAIERLGEKGAQAFAALTFTLPGNPLIYSGQEVGINQRLEFFEKNEIEWKSSPFTPFYQKLCSLYKNHPALYEGDLMRLSSPSDIYAFQRTKDQDHIITILNLSEKPVSAKIDFGKITGAFQELFKESSITINGGELDFALQPWDVRIYTSVK